MLSKGTFFLQNWQESGLLQHTNESVCIHISPYDLLATSLATEQNFIGATFCMFLKMER